MSFRNQYLSYSRVSRFAQCKHAFKLHYVDHLPSAPGDALRLGKLVHAVLETLVGDHVREERVGRIDRSLVRAAWKAAATAEGLSDATLFAEGLAMVEDAVRAEGELDARSVLALEKEFRLRAGRFEVVGFIDRVDAVDDETVRVIDYKSNRVLFTREEVDESLQMSLYELAVRRLWPWVRRVDLCFVMLRHGVRLHTSRTPEQLQAALDYVESVGEQSERETEFAPTLNANCGYCDHRGRCAAYAEALAGARTPMRADLGDLEAVAAEREQVARLAKLLYGRKDELDAVLKVHLEHRDELVLAGHRYRLSPTRSVTHRLERVVPFLARLTGRAEQELSAEVSSVDKRAVDAVVGAACKAMGASKARLVRTELESLADVTTTQRLVSSAVKA